MSEFLSDQSEAEFTSSTDEKIQWTTEEWDKRVLGSACRIGINVTSSLASNGKRLPELDFLGRKGREYEVLRDLYYMNKRLERAYVEEDTSQQQDNNDENLLIFGSISGPAETRYSLDKSRYLRNLAKEVRHKRHFYLLPSLANALARQQFEISDKRQESVLSNTYGILSADISALYLRTCDPNRFLVGLRERPNWKYITLPDFGQNEILPIRHIASPYLLYMLRIGSRESVAMPENIIHPDKIGQIVIPKPASSLEDYLEDAYYRQRFMIPLEGADVRFRKAGDIRQMLVVQSEDDILARTVTNKGDIFTTFNLGSAQVLSTDEFTDEQDRVVDLVGEVYNHLVTAKEISTTRYRRAGGIKGGRTIPGRVTQHQIIYIPRTVRTGPIIDRPPYQGPPRPIEPHRVTGHRRRANMTEEHRQALLDFERRHRISILKYLPSGFTYVRPFTVPAGIDLSGLPIFIKRRIETRLAQELGRPIS